MCSSASSDRVPRTDVHVGHRDRGRRQLGRSGRPGRHPRADPALAVRSKASGNRRLLVHFALSAVPAGCRVTDTTLRLNASAAANGRTLQAIRLAAPWTEGGVKWSNQPGPPGTAATTSSGSGWRQWTVTAR